MHIVYVSDGKAGHRSQALGLFKAIQRQSTEMVSFEEISIEDLAIFSLVAGIFHRSIPQLKNLPNLIIGVGSHTQLRVLLLGKIYTQAKTVILMKPNYPLTWFDYSVIPAHDGIPASARVIVTQGALNPIVNEQRHQSGRILIALGGSSKRHQWNEDKVFASIEHIVQQQSNNEIIITTSRRTPELFVERLNAHPFLPHVHFFPVEHTAQGWIFEEMQKAEAVWVTEDSVSMIYEALTAGCRVGVIAMDRIKQDRITASVDVLLGKSIVTETSDLAQLPPPNAFKEAERVATYLLAQ
ncbi:ELM1/GtrOC1 family putative glycosyltransferase [Acinetobacter zhairhuonensis]|uniref:ELM1/GtrOC1 family putative glycosyltransferase n=1 Tax=Acinetobacter sp. A7.4 TaxID=2919921 RepID=UPI001F4DD543|nr:ELM1/GtrOC1 family putative glycosyltransferase [Acinetobacter sp. A7.4]MCJ8161072.1 mitochondrial fission ELM1 family protein [Acinetobacter sp. A7.4]